MEFRIGSCNYLLKNKQFKDGFSVGTHVYEVSNQVNSQKENLKFIDYSSKTDEETAAKFRFMRQIGKS